MQNVIVRALFLQEVSHKIAGNIYKLICESNNWHYINNTNIKLKHLADDGYHPNMQGIYLQRT